MVSSCRQLASLLCCGAVVALLSGLDGASAKGLVFGGADTAKACDAALVNGTVKDQVADPDDCSQYYLCTGWFQSKMKCKKGQHFSAAQHKCTDPCEAACDPDVVCETSTLAMDADTTTGATAAVSEAAAVQTSTSSAANDAASDDPASTTSAAATDASTADVSTEGSGDGSEVSTDAGSGSDGTSTDEPATTVEAEAIEAVDASTVAVTETEAVETTTAFWQVIAKHFGNPPATIPGGFTGTIPPNF